MFGAFEFASDFVVESCRLVVLFFFVKAPCRSQHRDISQVKIFLRTDLLEDWFGFRIVARCEEHLGLAHSDFGDERVVGKPS